MAPCIIAVSFPMSTARDTQRTPKRYRTVDAATTPQRGKAPRTVVSCVGLTKAKRLPTGNAARKTLNTPREQNILA
jgi:hypothetical protein